jgi:hypothetical protein
MWSDDGNVSGIAQHQGYYYSIRPLGDGLIAIVELDQDLMPPDHQPQLLLASRDRFGQPNAVLTLSSLTKAPFPPTTRSKHLRAMGAGLPPKDVVIDVMADLIALAIDEANESFRISGIGHVKLRLVHAYQTSYVEEGSPLRSRLAPGREGRWLYGRSP